LEVAFDFSEVMITQHDMWPSFSLANRHQNRDAGSRDTTAPMAALLPCSPRWVRCYSHCEHHWWYLDDIWP